MGRLAVYAGVSTALAAGVVISAFNQRANFYSACVYLAQSNLCLMILINLIMFIYGTFMYGLQRICYGPLRPIEIEQLYEKGWFAVTETCLAMTIFREEVGAWFLVMFVALLTGKVWGWIGDGRVEILEQQPPANARLFHIRLSVSLTMSVLYDMWLMGYTINTVIQQARPNMMVMFLFEFAVLTTTSYATACRYCISLIEAKVVKQQTQERLAERRREVREERAEALRQREMAAVAGGEGNDAAPSAVPLPSEDDVDEMDIEVPGWEAKGQWVLTLDLMTDFSKLAIYVTFFVILLMFYGLPIHIMRDLFMTARSFTKRLAAFLRYRRATHDMNSRYEDATTEDIQREDTCIICREEMRPWSTTNPPAPPGVPGETPPARPNSTPNERNRPKKLPCGHILHLGCLKSWLERQQVCPTCRRPVVDETRAQARLGAPNNANAPGNGVPPGPGQNGGGVPPPAAGRGAGRGMRMLNLGPLRLGFGHGNLQDLNPQANQLAGNPRVYGLEFGFPRRQQPPPRAQEPGSLPVAATTHEQLQQIEQQIVTEIRGLQVAQQELQLVQLVQVELARLRMMQNGMREPLASNFQMPQVPQAPLVTRSASPFPQAMHPMQRHGLAPNTVAIPAGSADLPPGVTIPEGWSLLPLQRLDGHPVPQGVVVPASNIATAPTATTHPQPIISPTVGSSNNTSSTTQYMNPESRSPASSNDTSNTNANRVPPSVSSDQSNLAIPNTTMQSTTSSPGSFLSSIPAALGSSPLHSHSNQADSAGESHSVHPGTSQSISEPARNLSSTSNDIAHTEDEGSDAGLKQDKGKGKAASVEDTVDEADGS